MSSKDLSALPPRQAARALGISITTLRRWEEAGKITAFRTPGGQRRFPISEITRIGGGHV